MVYENLRDVKLIVYKKDKSNITYPAKFTLERFEVDSEEMLVRAMYEDLGIGKYRVQFAAKGRKGLSKSIWKGRIMQGESYIEYRNFIEQKHLEELGIDQRTPGENIRLQKN